MCAGHNTTPHPAPTGLQADVEEEDNSSTYKLTEEELQEMLEMEAGANAWVRPNPTSRLKRAQQPAGGRGAADYVQAIVVLVLILIGFHVVVLKNIVAPDKVQQEVMLHRQICARVERARSDGQCACCW